MNEYTSIFVSEKKQYARISEYICIIIIIRICYERIIYEYICIQKIIQTNIQIYLYKKMIQCNTNKYSEQKIFEYIQISEYSSHYDLAAKWRHFCRKAFLPTSIVSAKLLIRRLAKDKTRVCKGSKGAQRLQCAKSKRKGHVNLKQAAKWGGI